MVFEDTDEWQKTLQVSSSVLFGILLVILILSFAEALVLKKTEFLSAAMLVLSLMFFSFNNMLRKLDIWKNGSKPLKQKAFEFVPIVCLVAAVGLIL